MLNHPMGCKFSSKLFKLFRFQNHIADKLSELMSYKRFIHKTNSTYKSASAHRHLLPWFLKNQHLYKTSPFRLFHCCVAARITAIVLLYIKYDWSVEICRVFMHLCILLFEACLAIYVAGEPSPLCHTQKVVWSIVHSCRVSY